MRTAPTGAIEPGLRLEHLQSRLSSRHISESWRRGTWVARTTTRVARSRARRKGRGQPHRTPRGGRGSGARRRVARTFWFHKKSFGTQNGTCHPENRRATAVRCAFVCAIAARDIAARDNKRAYVTVRANVTARRQFLSLRPPPRLAMTSWKRMQLMQCNVMWCNVSNVM